MRREHDGRTEQASASARRLGDAIRLLGGGRPHERGAMYMAGYAVEARLKALGMSAHGCWTLEDLRVRLGVSPDDVYTHGLETLVRRLLPSGVHDRLRTSGAWRDFSHVNQWRPSWRYNPEPPPPGEAAQFLEAVQAVLAWLGNNV